MLRNKLPFPAVFYLIVSMRVQSLQDALGMFPWSSCKLWPQISKYFTNKKKGNKQIKKPLIYKKISLKKVAQELNQSRKSALLCLCALAWPQRHSKLIRYSFPLNPPREKQINKKINKINITKNKRSTWKLLSVIFLCKRYSAALWNCFLPNSSTAPFSMHFNMFIVCKDAWKKKRRTKIK